MSSQVSEQARHSAAAQSTAVDANGAGTKRLTIDVPKDVHRIMKVRSAEQDLTMSELVRSLIVRWITEEHR